MGVGHEEEEGGGWMVLRHACDDLDLTVTAAAATHRKCATHTHHDPLQFCNGNRL
jgi:hypothetical protein